MMVPENLLKGVLFGGGGHARVLLDCLHQSQQMPIVAILDTERSHWGQSLSHIPILGDDRLLPELVAQGVNSFLVGVGSVGKTQIRQTLFELGCAYQLRPIEVIHPTAIISAEATIGEGAQILPGSIVNTGATLGVNVIVNTGAIIEHDCWIEDHVHVSTGAKLAGGVHVGMGAHIGIGAVIRQGIRIGEQAIVGAGAAVVKDVPPHTTVVGVPARPLPQFS